MTDLQDLCTRAYHATANWERADNRLRWVMSRPWYDRLRAETATEDREAARAQAHVNARILSREQPPYKCPACPAGPFASLEELYDHATAMADPANREPADGDCLFGIRIEVREDGGEPHLELASAS